MFDAESETGLSRIMEVLDTSSDERSLHADAAKSPQPAVDDAIDDIMKIALPSGEVCEEMGCRRLTTKKRGDGRLQQRFRLHAS